VLRQPEKVRPLLEGLFPRLSWWIMTARILAVVAMDLRDQAQIDVILGHFRQHLQSDKMIEADLLGPEMAARLLLESGDMDGAARVLHRVPVVPVDGFQDLLLFQTLLYSTGRLKHIPAAEIKGACQKLLAGTSADLARMLLGQKAPKPGNLWPDARWRPELRLWLALWLETRGRKRDALNVILPSRDPRYGLIHSQQGIEALISRVQPPVLKSRRAPRIEAAK
jgi:hypothetical protein